MEACVFIQPGSFLVSDDREWAFKINGILTHISSNFCAAYAALVLFNQEQLRLGRSTREQRAKDFDRLQQIATYEMSPGSEPSEASLVLFKEKMRDGIIPQSISKHMIHLHAKSFVYSLDTIIKFFQVLIKEKNVPEKLIDISTTINEQFPHIKAIRDSSHHPEDRSRGLKRGGKAIDLKPVDNGMVRTNGKIIILSALNNDTFSATMENGFVGEIDISYDSLRKVRDIIQEIYNCFTWFGPKSYIPSY
jgi:hypothetical protein